MASKAESNSLEFLTCRLCFENLIDPYCLPCLHSFCKSCLKKFIGNNDHIKCPACKTSVSVNSIKRDFRCADFIEFFKKQTQSLPSCCSLCRGDIDTIEARLCIECFTAMCGSCYAAHKNNQKTKAHRACTLNSRDSFCSTHNKRLDLFCNESKCQKTICSECITENHLRHDIRSSNERKDFLRKEITFYSKLHKEKLNKLNMQIEALNDWKKRCDKSLYDIEYALTDQMTKMLVTTYNIYNEGRTKILKKHRHVKNYYHEKFDPLLMLKEDFSSFETTAAELRTMSFTKLCELYNAIKYNENDSNCMNLDDLGVHAVNSDHITNNDLVIFLQDYMGRIRDEEQLVNGNPLPLNENVNGNDNVGFEIAGNAFDRQYSTESDNEIISSLPNTDPYLIECYPPDCMNVQGLMYDKINNNLLVLETKEGFCIEKININGSSNKYLITKDVVGFGPAFLAQLSCGRPLVLYFSRKFANLVSISSDFESHEKFPILFFDMKKLILICSSDCRKYIFFYLSNHSIFRYDLVENVHTSATAKFPSIAEYMDVCEDLDLMAFSFVDRIALVSFKDPKVLRWIDDDSRSYGICFLNSRMLLSSTSNAVLLYDVRKAELYKVIEQIAIINKGMKAPREIAKASQSAFYVYSSGRFIIFKCDWSL